MAKLGEVIKGKPVADQMKEDLMREVAALKERGIYPKLTIVRVGARPDDVAYERGALKKCEAVGLAGQAKELPENISQEDFIREFKKVNEDKNIHGILLFRPLPKQLDENVIKHAISAEKDIDCLSPENVAKLTAGDTTGFPPCTPTAVLELLKFYKVPMAGKKVVILGRSMVVGKPAAMLLLNENATVTICHSKTENLPDVAREADILIAAIGKARMVKENFVKEGAVVIDVGINVDASGALCGDVDFDACVKKAAMITPVPAGVGAVTSSILIKHVVKACKMQNKLA